MERERERVTYITVQLQIILPHEKKLVSSNEKKKKFTYITREKASRLIYLERDIGWYILIYLEKHIGRYK